MINEEAQTLSLFERHNEKLQNLTKPTLVTAVELLPIDPRVRQASTRVRISFGVVQPRCELSVVFNERKGGTHIAVPFNERLYWHHASDQPNQYDYRVSPFTTWQTGGRTIVNVRVSGIPDFLEKTNWDHTSIRRLNVYIGYHIASQRLGDLAKCLGMDLTRCKDILPAESALRRILS